jgi:hypothetical protein
MRGVFVERATTRVHVPFYSVQNESYTTYFEKAERKGRTRQ